VKLYSCKLDTLRLITDLWGSCLFLLLTSSWISEFGISPYCITFINSVSDSGIVKLLNQTCTWLTGTSTCPNCDHSCMERHTLLLWDEYSLEEIVLYDMIQWKCAEYTAFNGSPLARSSRDIVLWFSGLRHHLVVCVCVITQIDHNININCRENLLQ
jgi:hypothetical protein